MLYHGITLAEGSDVNNLVVDSGTSFPSNPNPGELFYRTDLEYLYVYDGSTWSQVGSGGGGASLTATYVGYGDGGGQLSGTNTFTFTTPSGVPTLRVGTGSGSGTIIANGAGVSTGTIAVGGNDGRFTNLNGQNNLWLQPPSITTSNASGTTYVAGNDHTSAFAAGNLVLRGGNHSGSVDGGSVYIRGGNAATVANAGSVFFITNNTERLRINNYGAIGLSGANYGTSGQVLTSNGSSAVPTWQTPATASALQKTGDTMTGALGITLGSVTAPGLFFSGDTNTGIYSTGGDNLSITTAGTERVRVTGAGETQFFATVTEQTNNLGSLSGNQNISLAVGNYISFTVSNTLSITFTNPPSSGRAAAYILEVTNGGAFSITWNGVTWLSGTPPTLRSSGINLVGLITRNGGSTYLGTLLG